MKVTEIRLKVYLLKDVKVETAFQVIANYFDSCLCKNEEFMKLHESRRFKNYVFDQFYPLASDGVYKKDNVYTVRVRTVDDAIAGYFAGTVANHMNDQIKGLTRDIRVIPKKHLSEIFSITPLIMKCDGIDGNGYWKNNLTFDEFEKRIRENLIKKYNILTNSNIDESFQIYNQIKILNGKPIKFPIKDIMLLGDKVGIKAADNQMAQDILYMAIGCGIGELNSRGAGFVNYRYL